MVGIQIPTVDGFSKPTESFFTPLYFSFLQGVKLEVTWSKPPVDKTILKTKKQLTRNTYQ